MTAFELLTLLLCMCGIFGYFNSRVLKLPLSVTLMLFGILTSLSLLLTKHPAGSLAEQLIAAIKHLDFSNIVLDVMLCFLLFAGALHTDVLQLWHNRNNVAVFSLISVIVSTALCGYAVYLTAPLFTLNIPLAQCFLLGAILSPTDPIAILGLLGKSTVPEAAKINIVGESLFNDGVGVVLFVSILEASRHPATTFELTNAILTFIQQAIGGIVLGIVYGQTLGYLLKRVNDYEAEILLTLAVVTSGYWLASIFGASGPLAMVVAGLLTRRLCKHSPLQNTTKSYVRKFWHLLDIALNAILFLLMGLIIVSISFTTNAVLLACCTIVFAIAFRYISLLLPYTLGKRWLSVDHKTIKLMTWGGLRGGLSIAMALSLDDKVAFKQEIVVCTYVVVLFSIFVQALSMNVVVKKIYD
jgi:monovalent cation:H+ antiporter, CPA1 family